MKTLRKTLSMILMPALLITACNNDKEDEKTEQTSVPEKKVNPDLEKVIDDLAACDGQNTNCEAYNIASEYIESECADDAKRESIVDDLFTMIEGGPSSKSQAAAHAVNFWTYSDFKEDPEYGMVVLNALKKESYDQANYAGSQLGQLLSSWYTTDDQELYQAILDLVKDQNTEMRGRMELIRLLPYDKISDPEVFSILADIINDADEIIDVRIQSLNVLWRVDDEELTSTARTIYESFIFNPNLQIAGTSMLGLGYMNSSSSYELISEKLIDEMDNKDWCYYGSYTLSSLIESDPESLDMNAVLALVKELITNKNVSAYSRSYYVSTLIKMDTSESKLFLNQLKKEGEEDMVKEIEYLMG